MSVVIVIPARYASSRFPGKPLQPLTGLSGISKPLIQHAWEAAKRVPDIDAVYVATDDERIEKGVSVNEEDFEDPTSLNHELMVSALETFFYDSDCFLKNN